MRINKKLVIIGAGSTMFSKKVLGDILLFDDFELDEIALVDINTEKLEVMRQVAERMVRQAGKSTLITAGTDRRKLLKNAGFVICTIGVGGPERYEKDLLISDKYGVVQNVGDIVGPCGMMRMLREYPEILRICKDCEELCPDVYFLNYSNPCAALTIALSQATTIKVYGICHNVQTTWVQLADYLHINKDDLSYWCAGINHMDWFLELTVNGEDVYPKLFEMAEDRELIKGLAEVETHYHNDGIRLVDYVRFDIMKRFGYFVSESPFHMSEYVAHYRKTPEMIAEWDVGDRWWLKHEYAADITFEELKEKLVGGEEIPMEKSIEYTPEIIHAIVTGKTYRANLNVMNEGRLISNLPQECAVEVPCFVDDKGIHPCYIGKLPNQLAALNASNAYEQIIMAEAANENSREKLKHAALVDPFTSAQCTTEQICKLMDELIDSNKEDGFLSLI